MTRKNRAKLWLEKQGYVVWDVEMIIPRTFIRRDMFGIFDLAALHKNAPGVLGIQVTAGGGDIQKHVRKMQANPNLELWIHCGNEALLISVDKRGPRGKRKTWQCKEIPVTV